MLNEDQAAFSWVVPEAASLLSLALPEMPLFPGSQIPTECRGSFTAITNSRTCLAHGLALDLETRALLLGLLTRESVSLRSTLARNSLYCAGELGEGWREGLDFAGVCAPLLGALLGRASNSADKRFIRDSAMVSLKKCALAQPCTEVLCYLLQQGGKNPRNFASALVSTEVADSLLSLLPDTDAVDLPQLVGLLTPYFICRCAAARTLAAGMLSFMGSCRGVPALEAAINGAPTTSMIKQDILQSLGIERVEEGEETEDEGGVGGNADKDRSRDFDERGGGGGEMRPSGGLSVVIGEDENQCPLDASSSLNHPHSPLPFRAPTLQFNAPSTQCKSSFREALKELRALSTKRPHHPGQRMSVGGGVGGGGEEGGGGGGSGSSGEVGGVASPPQLPLSPSSASVSFSMAPPEVACAPTLDELGGGRGGGGDGSRRVSFGATASLRRAGKRRSLGNFPIFLQAVNMVAAASLSSDESIPTSPTSLKLSQLYLREEPRGGGSWGCAPFPHL